MLILENKVALVTGAGQGIGRAVALKLASAGARVVVNDIDAEKGQAVAAEIQAMDGQSSTCNGSVVDAAFGARFIQAALDAFGVPDIIINNAGYTWDNVIQNMTDEQFDAMTDVHLKAPFRILRAVQPHWKAAASAEAASGRTIYRKVVNVSSAVGLGGNPGQVNYAAAKAGVVGMTKTLAKEWGRYCVNVNCVAFGLIATRLTGAREEKEQIEIDGNPVAVGIPPAAAEAFNRMIPLGRPGTPEEAAGAVYLLCLPESDYITGHTLECGGGLSF